jgi:dTDP-4-dehydrorhamnose reductase
MPIILCGAPRMGCACQIVAGISGGDRATVYMGGQNRLMSRQKILVLGASGMLGNTVLRYFATRTEHEVVGVVRSGRSLGFLPTEVRGKIINGEDVENFDALVRLFDHHRPTVVINCVGLIKQLGDSKDPLAAIPINSVLPHRLARLCALVGARMIHPSTDCVFSGAKGLYGEGDLPDATDVYGRTKLLGDVDYPHVLTLRTSIIGHELAGHHSLVCWFLAQEGAVRGFSKAVFSGLPTVEIARIINEYVLPFPELSGLYHLSAEPIDKYSLLKLIAKIYGKAIRIDEDPGFIIDRSLDSGRFRSATGFLPEDWPTLVCRMHEFH